MTDPYPIRKPMGHTPPFPADDAWYFITICAAEHRPWRMAKPPADRAVAPRPPQSCNNECVADDSIVPPSFDDIATIILNGARENHMRGIWRLSLFLVMPDHIHAIMHIPTIDSCGGRGATALPLQHRPVGMARIIANFKHLLSTRYGIAFQRDFFDTRIRDDAHYAEKWRYICANPVTRGLVATPREWPHALAFDCATGEELPHR